MLILPLHRPLTRATFPVVTALLLLANVIVYFGFQWGDDAKLEAALVQYEQSGLARLEVPAYERWVETRGGRGKALDALRAAPDDKRGPLVARETLFDPDYERALQTGTPFADAKDFAAWKPLRARYDAQLEDIFTWRHVARASEFDLGRMLASTFLHADPLHLFGNMLFLVALGLLVEGAIGPWRFLVVYVLGGLGASAASLAWHWGEATAGLGASGAIAALMGAFCFIWGRQRVRFFFWIGVWFDYVRAPALWLFPAWLGWEVFNLLTQDDARVAFEAHAGGLVTGAVLGWALSATGQVRQAFLRDEDPAAARDDRWERAQRHIGRMQLAEADALLETLAAEQPQRVDVRIARYRVARNGGRAANALERAMDALSIDARDVASATAQVGLLDELDAQAIALPASLRLSLAQRFLAMQWPDAAEHALQGLPADEVVPEQSQRWFEVALRYRDAGAHDAHLRCLRLLAQRHPGQPQAAKARFLLEQA
ncbi:hypothetical protein LYSHEL_24090 [Lysobacter helvus]|uniref:Peptidase S54 rhomboid domain-containing protein n=2 Tax=Lysobacteraceae TaxID=32033 RepID=A0ABN6FVJ7_9GAMM|nr:MULTISPECIES: rhomboid family intramembrane serine protease [Lysobacter]BCT93385.1 hypothetical protein LYSCAS_24090 [Lysobacter caseinilyticus]BCT96538.1 hypothetical protein LYSHEL_24090 [Lysobacter helvus]